MATTTQQLVSTIKQDYLPELSRTTILSYLNRALKVLGNKDCAQTTYWNFADPTFPFPILNTTAGTLSYKVSATNLVDSTGTALTPQYSSRNVSFRRLKYVFLKVDDMSGSNYDRKWYGEQVQISGLNPYWSQQLFRTTFYKVPCQIDDYTNSEAAPRVTFFEDPGTHDDMYFVEAYRKPFELTSESIPLCIDGDLWEQALIDGAVGFAEDWQHGKSERLNKFQTFWEKKFSSYMNDNMEERAPQQMQIRVCG